MGPRPKMKSASISSVPEAILSALELDVPASRVANAGTLFAIVCVNSGKIREVGDGGDAAAVA